MAVDKRRGAQSAEGGCAQASGVAPPAAVGLDKRIERACDRGPAGRARPLPPTRRRRQCAAAAAALAADAAPHDYASGGVISKEEVEARGSGTKEAGDTYDSARRWRSELRIFFTGAAAAAASGFGGLDAGGNRGRALALPSSHRLPAVCPGLMFLTRLPVPAWVDHHPAFLVGWLCGLRLGCTLGLGWSVAWAGLQRCRPRSQPLPDSFPAAPTWQSPHLTTSRCAASCGSL